MQSGYIPIIGKTVIETLTAGMYADSLFIYREYIQNAADQIDVAVEEKILDSKASGLIKVTCSAEEKAIHIEDNATGISHKEVLVFLSDIANSTKSHENRKGFRGIGRLGGLGYCDRLIFETSYKGESVVSTITLDSQLLTIILTDRANTSDAASVIKTITSIEQRKGPSSSHYFKVSLINVKDEKLCDEKVVVDYLKMVAPLPFSDEFSFAEEIKKRLVEKYVVPDEYLIIFNGSKLVKPYRDIIEDEGNRSKVIGIDFIEIRDAEQSLIGIGWYAFRDQANIVMSEKVLEKGIRIRRNNIGIGTDKETNKFFVSKKSKSPQRTNARLIGEIYAIGPNFIPNARRDYFNANDTLKAFEEGIKTFFQEEDLENLLGQNASKLYNRLEEIEDYRVKYETFASRTGHFQDQAEEHHYAAEVQAAKKRAIKARNVIAKIEDKGKVDKKVKKLYDTVIGSKDLNVPGEDDEILAANNYKPLRFKKLSKEQEVIAREITELIENVLGYEKAKPLKAAILRKYN